MLKLCAQVVVLADLKFDGDAVEWLVRLHHVVVDARVQLFKLLELSVLGTDRSIIEDVLERDQLLLVREYHVLNMVSREWKRELRHVAVVPLQFAKVYDLLIFLHFLQ